MSKLASLNFKAISWNANGLDSHLPELLHYLSNETKTPDFICIQETKIYVEILPKIPGFDSIHKFRAHKNGGGSAIYIKNNIDFLSIDDIIFNDIDLEVSGVTFRKNNTENISILSVYIAPGQKLSLIHLNKLIINKNIILLGDFNAKNKIWGSPINDFRGKIVEQFLEDNSLVCLNTGECTRLNYNGTLSHLDLIISSHGLSPNINCSKINDLWGSDHYPMIMECSLDIDRRDLISVNKYDYNRANWTLFHDTLQNDNSTFNEIVADVDYSYSTLVSSFIAARDLSIPKKG